jgi:hypothetical protein
MSEEAEDMATSGTIPATARSNSTSLVVMRILGALALLAMAGIHLYLWGWNGYDQFSVIGPLFLINAIVGALLGIAVAVLPTRMLAITSTLSALFELGTLVALLVSIFWGLFGVQESFQFMIVNVTLIVEGIGVVLLAVLAAMASKRAGVWGWVPDKS